MKNTSLIQINPALTERFNLLWPVCRIFYFSAPCGFGKTSAAQELLRGRKAEFRSASQGGLFDPLSEDTEAVVFDDLQLLTEQPAQQTLCAFLRENPELHFLLLSRAPTPGWLMPFQFAGVMECFDTESLRLDLETTRALLAAGGVEPGAEELTAIYRDAKGYGLVLSILRRQMAGGAHYDEAMYLSVSRELYTYFDEAIFRRFDKALRSLLLDLSPFESFTAEMAKLVSGDPHAGELLGRLLRETSMVLYERVDVYRIYPIFRKFLAWEAKQLYTPAEERAIYSRAGLYYELNGDLPHALECYSRSGDDRKISELLEKHAKLHPGVGHYYETEEYYRALPREEVLRSPSLMCGMSMLCAMTMDFEGSEMWYQALQDRAARLRRSDSEYREIRGNLAYLDIALPQRGSGGLVELISSVFHVMTDKEVSVPAFSVTSTLPSIMNGGKDFCDWSKRDDLLYATMRMPVVTVLGRDGVGLPDCAICESKFEKGVNVSDRLLNLVTHLGEIQAKGTPDIEFAVVGLLAREQTMRGDVHAAREAIASLRERFSAAGEDRFLPNIDAMLCRFDLRGGNKDAVAAWRRDKAPRDTLRLRALWRYQYFTLAMTQIAAGEYDAALLVLSPLMSYCETCSRTMDLLYGRLLTAICRYRKQDPHWDDTFRTALDDCWEYRFVTPAAQHGAAILPLLTETKWTGDKAFLKKLLAAARKQAVFYPDFLKCAATLSEPLTATEQQVLRLLCHDMSNQEIGDTLDIRLATVKTHVSHILQKLGVSRRSEAKAAAEALHLL